MDPDLMAKSEVRPKDFKMNDWHSPLHFHLNSPDLVDQQIEELEPTLWSSNVGPTEFLPESEREKYYFDRETRQYYLSETHCNYWWWNL